MSICLYMYLLLSFVFFFIFFFFKQKTAYEMRISDWSSDVCSSDLMEKFILKILPIAAAFAASLIFSTMSYVYLSVSFVQMLKAMNPVVVQIGRASCRERVCQYV